MPFSLKPWRAAVVTTVALLGAGVTYLATDSPAPPQPPVVAGILSDDSRDAAVSSRRASPRAEQAGQAPRVRSAALPAAKKSAEEIRPTRVHFPSLDVRMPITPVGVNRYGGAFIPKNPEIAGWYRHGAAPGDRRGATVLMAHVDNDQRLGPLAALGSLSPGDRINVTSAGDRIGYRVLRVGRVPKDDLDTDALFSRTSQPRLHVVTCGGPFDERDGGYRDNIVAVAVPIAR